MEDGIRMVIGLLFIGLIALIPFMVYKGIQRQNWLEEHCNIIGKMSASTGVGNSFVNGKIGVGTTYIPGKIGYKCDDGLEYWE